MTSLSPSGVVCERKREEASCPMCFADSDWKPAAAAAKVGSKQEIHPPRFPYRCRQCSVFRHEEWEIHIYTWPYTKYEAEDDALVED